MSDWPKLKIGDLGKVVTGKTPSTKEECNFGCEYPFITIPDLDGRRDIATSERYLSAKGAGKIKNQLLPSGSVLMSCIATVGKCGITTKDSFTNQQINSVIPHDNVVPEFLYYSFRRLGSILEMHGGGGSVYTNISKSRFADIEVQLPNVAIQKAIAHILSTLDDKIALNRKLNATLEAMAQALFQSWFVDFDPVKAQLAAVRCGRDPEQAAMAAIASKLVVPPGKPKAENLEEKLPTAEAIDAAIAALAELSEAQRQSLKEKAAHFPADFQESELGLIPQGWEVGKIEDLCEFVTSGGTPSRKNERFWNKGQIDWFKTGELLDGPLLESKEKITKEGLDNSSCKMWPADTVIFAMYASPTLGRLGILSKEGTSNQAAAGMLAKKSYGLPFLKETLLVARPELQKIAVGAAQQNINLRTLKAHEVIMPTTKCMCLFSQLVTPLYGDSFKLHEQVQTLANLRDALLPKLLSGEISVSPN